MTHRSLQPPTNFSSSAIWRSRRIYFVGAFGTVIEWYDFALYGILSNIFAKQFFYHLSHSFALVIVYLVFFISYLARPLGGLFYGFFGDHWGRKPALLLSIFMMTTCMLFIAALPSWKTVGESAPLCLIIARIIQGLSVGGETVGSLIYVLESVESNRQGLFGAIISALGWIGFVCAAALTVLFMHLLSMTQFSTWGWRLAYLIGGIAGLIVFFLRTAIPESIEFEQATTQTTQQQHTIASIPFKKSFVQCWPTVFSIIALLALSATIGAFIDVYFPQYIHQYFSVSLANVWNLNIIALTLGIVGMIAFGALSDRIGRTKLLVFGASCFLLLSYPLLTLLSIGQWSITVVVMVLFSIGSAIYSAPLPALTVKLAPLEVRYTVFALGYNIAVAVFAGSAPLVCSLLAKLSPLAPAFYFIALALLSLSILYFISNRPSIPAKYQQPLSTAN